MKQRPLAVSLLVVIAWCTDAAAQKKKPPPSADPDPKPPIAEADRRISSAELTLAVGENKTIPAVDVKNYSEGTPGVVDVKLTSDAQQFVVVGLKPGSTSLLLIKKSGQEVNWIINVYPKSPEQVESEVRQLLEGYTGVRLRRVGGRFFIEGVVAADGDAARVKQIAALYPGQAESLVQVGVPKDRSTNIRIDFFFVQYDKNSSYGVGIGWPNRIGGGTGQFTLGYDFIAKNTTATITNVVNQPLPGLDIAATYGWAKVLKQATVITTNGTDATLDTGGEQNFPISSGLTNTVYRVKFGTELTVQPRFDPQTRELEIKVTADVNDLIPPVRNTPIPGRQTTKLGTIVHMKLGQSLVLSGFHTKLESDTTNGIPLLSDIPVLGVLFGSHARVRSEVEGAVFIVPSVVEASSKPAIDMLNEGLAQYEEYSGKMPDVYRKTPPPPPPPLPPSAATPPRP